MSSLPDLAAKAHDALKRTEFRGSPIKRLDLNPDELMRYEFSLRHSPAMKTKEVRNKQWQDDSKAAYEAVWKLARKMKLLPPRR